MRPKYEVASLLRPNWHPHYSNSENPFRDQGLEEKVSFHFFVYNDIYFNYVI